MPPFQILCLDSKNNNNNNNNRGKMPVNDSTKELEINETAKPDWFSTSVVIYLFCEWSSSRPFCLFVDYGLETTVNSLSENRNVNQPSKRVLWHLDTLKTCMICFVIRLHVDPIATKYGSRPSHERNQPSYTYSMEQLALPSVIESLQHFFFSFFLSARLH